MTGKNKIKRYIYSIIFSNKLRKQIIITATNRLYINLLKLISRDIITLLAIHNVKK